MILRPTQEIFLAKGKQFLLGELTDLFYYLSGTGGPVRGRTKVYWWDEEVLGLESFPDPCGIRSYRGYYEELAIPGTMNKASTIDTWIKCLRDVNGSTYQGYKGGEYVMTRNTPLWAASYGDNSARFIQAVIAERPKEGMEDGAVELVTGWDYFRVTE